MFFLSLSTSADGAGGDGNAQREGGLHEQSQESEDSTAECPALVVYMVDPFTYSQEWDHLNRLAMIGLLHCYQELVKTLPEQMQNHVSLQVCCLFSFLFFLSLISFKFIQKLKILYSKINQTLNSPNMSIPVGYNV